MHQQLVVEKISSILEATDNSYDVKLTALLDDANRIFIAGAGRSKLVGNFFAMRLVHGGYTVRCVVGK
jgi:D-arabinose 5-phosphate isomerase GutQ